MKRLFNLCVQWLSFISLSAVVFFSGLLGNILQRGQSYKDNVNPEGLFSAFSVNNARADVPLGGAVGGAADFGGGHAGNCDSEGNGGVGNGGNSGDSGDSGDSGGDGSSSGP